MLYLKNKEGHEEAQAVVDRYNDELTETYSDMLERVYTVTLKAYQKALQGEEAFKMALQQLWADSHKRRATEKETENEN